MLWSQSKNIAFIHVQKAAGNSIAKHLANSCDDAKQIVSQHARVRDVIPILGEDQWGKINTFAFVRNPWDRLVSWYSMIAHGTSRHDLFYWRKPAIWRYAVKNSTDFSSFIKNCTATIFDNGINKSFVFDQYSYIEHENGGLAVKFVGKFENLNSDLAHILSESGIDYVKLEHLNLSRRERDYRTYYNDETAEIVAKRFARDIKAFDYKF